MSSAKARFYLFGSWVIIPLLALASAELLLGAFWTNPYLLSNNHGVYTRFHPPELLLYAAIRNRLYPGEHRVRIFVDSDMALSGGSTNSSSDAISIGGSTTESALVPEGHRWPDLLDQPARNFGVSGNTSIDGYYDLKYLVETEGAKLERVFIMFAINDLRTFLSKGPGKFAIEGWNEPIENAAATIDQVNERVLFGIRIRDSALLSYLRYSTNNFVGRDFFSSYYQQRQAQAGLFTVTETEFDRLMKTFKSEFLPQRRRVYEQISELANRHNLRLVLLSQPHAYTLDYEPYQVDLRLLPRLDDKKMSIGQAAALMNSINAQTRELAGTLGHDFIDVATCFSQSGTNHLFYDSVHYTLRGSHELAGCVNRHLRNRAEALMQDDRSASH
jgi:lysophospholipase L1-like esterase